ncbi:MAG: hypothetical protein ACKVP0_22350 [Pirellulaceae bacterium]
MDQLLVSRVGGGMLLCESCTEQIMSNPKWEQETPAQTELSHDDVRKNMWAFFKALKAVQANGIIAYCKEMKFIREQAKVQARDHARLWWSYPALVEAKIKSSAKYWWAVEFESCKKCEAQLPGGVSTITFCPQCGAYREWGLLYGVWALVTILFAAGLAAFFYFEHPATRSISAWVIWTVGLLVFQLSIIMSRRPPNCQACGARRHGEHSCPKCGQEAENYAGRSRWLVVLFAVAVFVSAVILVAGGVTGFLYLLDPLWQHFVAWGGWILGGVLLLGSIAGFIDAIRKKSPPPAQMTSSPNDKTTSVTPAMIQGMRELLDLKILAQSGVGLEERAIAEKWGPQMIAFMAAPFRQMAVKALEVKLRVELGEITREQGDSEIKSFQPVLGKAPPKVTD